MRAAIYARYSTDMQSGASVEDQLHVCRKLIATEGWTEVETYSDAAISGARQHRPGFQRLLRDAADGRFDVVVAESIDRLSRDQEHVAALYKRLSFLSIPIHTVAEGPVTELHVGLKGTMSALFLRDLAQKTRRGLEGRVRQGKSAGGISFGYRVRRSLDPSGVLTTGDREIDPDEAETVLRIFRAFAKGESPRQIASELNRDGIPCPTGKAWGSSTIHGNPKRGTGILNNELYIGRLIWNRQRFIKDPETGNRVSRPNPPDAWVIRDVPELRIVPDDLWESVKAQQKRRRHDISDASGALRPERARRTRYLFSGLVTCGCCGGSFTLVNKTKYGCAAARNKGTCDNRRTIERELLEERVLSGLRQSLMHPELIATYLEAYQREWQRLHQDSLSAQAKARKDLGRVTRQIAQIITAIKDGMYHASMKAEMDDLEARKAELEGQLAQNDAPAAPVLHPNFAQAYRRRVDVLAEALNDDANRAEAVALLRGLITEIRLTPEAEGMAIDLVGKLASILSLVSDKQKPQSLSSGAGSVTMVAGVGFEPTTFRL